MKDVITFSEMLRRDEVSRINEGLLSSIKNLFTSDYVIKNKILRELLREVDCPITWKETKLRNSVYKVVDEFVASQSKAYAEELKAAKEKDTKEEEGEIVFDSESRFGTLKSKRLVEKANATLSALKNLVSSSKTGKEDATKWANIVYDLSVIATIQTALNEEEIDDKLKETETNALDAAQKKLQEEVTKAHDAAANDLKKAYNDVANKNRSISSYDKLSSKSALDGFTKALTDASKSKDHLTNFIDEKEYALNASDTNYDKVMGVAYAFLAGRVALDDSIKEFAKNTKNADDVLNLAYGMCDAVLSTLAEEKPDNKVIDQLKPFFNGEKNIGNEAGLSAIMQKLYRASISAVTNLDKKVLEELGGLQNIAKNSDLIK